MKTYKIKDDTFHLKIDDEIIYVNKDKLFSFELFSIKNCIRIFRNGPLKTAITRNQQMVGDFFDGLSKKEIAKKNKISVARVDQILWKIFYKTIMFFDEHKLAIRGKDE